jgi:hypothetical protein
MSDTEMVRALLAQASIAPTTESDVAALVAAHAMLRAAADALYDVDEARYESPATRFEPAPVFADWG